jgi:hypothetical protein
MECDRLIFSGHAVRRMFEREIPASSVRQVVAAGEIIAEYPDDSPYPSFLMLGHLAQRVLHVVVARNASTGDCIVVTVYSPEAGLWDGEFKRRKR